MRLLLAFVALLASVVPLRADWPTLRGNPQRTGSLESHLSRPFRVVWVRHFVGERLGTAMEPIVGDGKLFVATHQGHVYALDAQTGNPLWRFQGHGPFLHAPAYQNGVVVAGCTDGTLYALDAATGRERWSVFVGRGGFAASPTLADAAVFIGSRSGEFLAVELDSGAVRWRARLDAPIRQSAAFAQGKVFVTAEDMRLRCLEGKTGRTLWTSPPLIGQSVRDYYPVVWQHGDKTWVVVRTSPVLGMGRHLSADRAMLCQQAGVDNRDWRTVDAWIKSPAALGNQKLWDEEQAAIVAYLQRRPLARSFFVFDADTGSEPIQAPVLWIGGCQGEGVPPVALSDGRLLVFYRSAYGNWNLGVAPLVALGFLNPSNKIQPLRHKHGAQPPWNTFWGTADEAQNFVAAGNTVFIVHQGTLSAFDVTTQELFHVAGTRDSWGGFRNLPWARNEWHGPARSGIAIVPPRLYWQTGSRILCIASGSDGPPAPDAPVDGAKVPTTTARQPPNRENVLQELEQRVEEVLAKRWAPLITEPGLAGRQTFFDNSRDVFEALAWAYPHLHPPLQHKVRDWLKQEWVKHPPYADTAWYALHDGARRERHGIPPEELGRNGVSRYHPFGNMYVIRLYAERCDGWEQVQQDWPHIKTAFKDFAKTGWKLNPERGDLYANRYLSSLYTFIEMAKRAGDAEAAMQAQQLLEENTRAWLAWWKGSATGSALKVIPDISAWDEFINRGDSLFLSVRPHNSKIALFQDMTPELAQLLKTEAPEAADKLWRMFETLCPTWHLLGEERQVHFGENRFDPPDFALAAFKTLTWLRDGSAAEMYRRLDLPFCRADLFHVVKLALLVEKESEAQKRPAD